jgi:hypothetical protein
MGAKPSCCAYSSPRTGPKKEKGRKEKERQEERYEPRQVSLLFQREYNMCLKAHFYACTLRTMKIRVRILELAVLYEDPDTVELKKGNEILTKFQRFLSFIDGKDKSLIKLGETELRKISLLV